VVFFKGVQGFVEREGDFLDAFLFGFRPGQDVVIKRPIACFAWVNFSDNSVKSCQQHGRDCQVGVAGAIRCAIFNPHFAWVGGILGGTDSGIAVALTKEAAGWGFKTWSKALEGIGGGICESAKSRSVVENAANVIQGCFAQVGIATGIVENIEIIFEQELMKMHAAACSAKKWLWHEGDSFALTISQVLRQVLDHHGAIGGFENILEWGFNFAMSRTAGFVVVVFYFVAEIFHHQRNFIAQILVLIARSNLMISPVIGNQVAIGGGVLHPIGFE